MASMQIEVAASSSPFSYVSLKDHKRSANNMGYINPQYVRKNKADDKDQDEDSSWLPSQDSKTDDSWLPTISRNSTITIESKGSRHQKVENNADDSWLPTVGDNNGKSGTNANESENDVDYSWLPSTFIDNVKNKEKSDNINKNASKTKKNNTNISNSNSNNSCLQKQSQNNDHWVLARKVVFSDQQNQNAVNLKTTTDSSCSRLQDSPSQSRYVVESPNSSGVSSLLQRWKGLAEDKNPNNNDSGPTCKDHKTDNASPSSPTNSDANLETDKESLLRQFSCPLPSRESKASNPGAAEKEKIQVVDIIKKLSREEELAASNVAGQGNQSLPLIRTNLHTKQIEGEPKGIKGVKVSRHLIRGRHAFDTFLMQMEKDKHRELKSFVERKVVSNFKHRGRIQSLLRFKLLRLGAEPKPEDKTPMFCVPKPLESNKGQDMIMDIRFNSRNEKGVMESRKDKRNDQKNIASEESVAATSTTTKEVEIKTKTTTTNKKQVIMVPNQSTHVSMAPSKVAMNQVKFVDSYSSPTKIKEDDQYKNNNDDDDNDDFYEDEGQFMSAKTSYDQMENRNRRMQALESFNDWMTSENSQIHSESDEDESCDMQLFDTNDDWISHISRPKSDWEDMRQARYEEMLEDQSSANGDIQRLLERKNVSSFLGSGLRDLIDQLMTSRIQQSQTQTEKQDLVVRKKAESGKEIELQDGLVVAEDRRSITETKCSKYNEYVDQASYLERSWKPNDVVCNSETTTTTSPSETTTTTSPSETATTTSPFIEPSFSFKWSHNNSIPQSSPAITHQTIEMELIYEMRGHMEQLHHEIMDLRKSIKSCVNMQVKLQYSFKQNVGAAATHSAADQRINRKPSGIVQHNCSICYDAQVDSLLYRCGHMCTCFDCAMELKRTSEECPVCESPILDVVKVMRS